MSDRTATRRVRAYIGLGANVGDAAATLAWAVSALAVSKPNHLYLESRLPTLRMQPPRLLRNQIAVQNSADALLRPCDLRDELCTLSNTKTLRLNVL